MTTNFIDSFSGGSFYSLKKLALKYPNISRLPVSIRVVLESLLRNCDGKRVDQASITALANWKPNEERTKEIPFVVSRVLLQDLTGVPLGVDLAAMRSLAAKLGKDSSKIEPLVPVDLVVDHSVQVDYSSQVNAFKQNLDLEFERNIQRYEFLKWCSGTFKKFRVIPPGIGICHQVNLEYLAAGVLEKDGVWYPDTLVGTDSHTTMINGLGVVGWGVGGIEAEAAMLGQPVYFLTPDVVGVHLKGSLKEGTTATDLVLRVTELLRKQNVVGKFVEFFGEGAASLPVPDRATISNMAPEYGATMGFFPVDEKTCEYMRATGRSEQLINTLRDYYTAQGLFGIPKAGECDYSTLVELDLSSVVPSVAGPKRPQDRIELPLVKQEFEKTLPSVDKKPGEIQDGDVLIAAITSCTNTSNPYVMVAAGLVAKRAVEKGLTIDPKVKRSLAPGSRAVSDYLEKTDLQKYFDQIGFNLVGYGCTTCIGNSGPLDPKIEKALLDNDVIGASVLSGNRNFEARVHQSIKANFLMSPPLVVAYALAGSMRIDITKEPLGIGKDGNPVFLKDIWPSLSEVAALVQSSINPDVYRRLYRDFEGQNEMWAKIPETKSVTYSWNKTSTYIQEPPYFDGFALKPRTVEDIESARALAIFGDSVTTDHISPAGGIKTTVPAGKFLLEKGVKKEDFNSYGARRGNHEVMIRGTFANVRIKNLMVQGIEGGVTIHQPSGEQLPIFDASTKYIKEKTPLVIFAGQEYGTGSSRDWAAKGTMLLGVKAVVAQSFERIHRSNLVGMGVLPCQFIDGANAATLGIQGDEIFSITGLENGISPRKQLKLTIERKDGSKQDVSVLLRIDTAIEVEYYKFGGIMQYVLSNLL